MTKHDPLRVLDPVMEFPTHEQGMKPCLVLTSTAVHTVTLTNGASFAAIVHNTPATPCGAVVVVDRAEGEALVALLQNAMDDADRLNRGEPALARQDPGSLQ